MQISDYSVRDLKRMPIPEAGLIHNPPPRPRRRISEYLYVLLGGIRRRDHRGGRSIKTTSEFSR